MISFLHSETYLVISSVEVVDREPARTYVPMSPFPSSMRHSEQNKQWRSANTWLAEPVKVPDANPAPHLNTAVPAADLDRWCVPKVFSVYRAPAHTAMEPDKSLKTLAGPAMGKA